MTDSLHDIGPSIPPPPRESAQLVWRARSMLGWFAGRPRASIAAGAGVVCLAVAALFWQRIVADDLFTAMVRRGTLVPRLTVSGSLMPAQALTYRSPLAGREAEITFLVAEGTLVNEGDLLARIDTTDLQRELDRAVQDVRQAQVDVQVADIDRQEGQAALDSLVNGEGALSLDETRTRLQLAERKIARLREAHDGLRPLLEQGFITRDELRKTADELEQAEEDLALTRRRSEVLVERTYPRDRKRAELQLAQKDAQRQNVRTKLLESEARVHMLRELIEGSNLYARRAGLVVHEEYLSANPRRKIRTGDRVTGSQGLVTIPEVSRMLVEASASESDVRRIKPGQAAVVRLEAFPDLRLAGTVARVGTLARASTDRLFNEKRFDLIVELSPTDAEVRPEMTARVDVMLGDRRDVLLLPVNAVFEQQGLPVVHVVGPLGVETRAVQLGESDGMDVEVTAGLTDGERVALADVAGGRPPAAAPDVTAPGKATTLKGRDRSPGALEPR